MSLLFILLVPTHAYPADATISFDTSADQLFLKLEHSGARNLLEALDLFDPQFFRMGNFRLFFQSDSIQPSSKKYPRIVFLGKDSKLFIGFNHKLGDQRNLEIIQYRESEKKWEFREISFENGKAVLSSANPRMCLHCHGGRDAKPNTLRLEASRLELSVPFPSLIRLTPFENEKFWREFIANSEQDPIYAKLDLPSQSSQRPTRP